MTILLTTLWHCTVLPSGLIVGRLLWLHYSRHCGTAQFYHLVSLSVVSYDYTTHDIVALHSSPIWSHCRSSLMTTLLTTLWHCTVLPSGLIVGRLLWLHYSRHCGTAQFPDLVSLLVVSYDYPTHDIVALHSSPIWSHCRSSLMTTLLTTLWHSTVPPSGLIVGRLLWLPYSRHWGTAQFPYLVSLSVVSYDYTTHDIVALHSSPIWYHCRSSLMTTLLTTLWYCTVLPSGLIVGRLLWLHYSRHCGTAQFSHLVSLSVVSYDYTTHDIVAQHSSPIWYHCRSSLMTTLLTTLWHSTVLPSGIIVGRLLWLPYSRHCGTAQFSHLVSLSVVSYDYTTHDIVALHSSPIWSHCWSSLMTTLLTTLWHCTVPLSGLIVGRLLWLPYSRHCGTAQFPHLVSLSVVSYDYPTHDIGAQHSSPIWYHCRSSLMTTLLTTLWHCTVLPSGIIVGRLLWLHYSRHCGTAQFSHLVSLSVVSYDYTTHDIVALHSSPIWYHCRSSLMTTLLTTLWHSTVLPSGIIVGRLLWLHYSRHCGTAQFSHLVSLSVVSYDYTTHDIVAQHSSPIWYHCRSSLMTTLLTTLWHCTVLPSGLIVGRLLWLHYSRHCGTAQFPYLVSLSVVSYDYPTHDIVALHSSPIWSHCGLYNTRVDHAHSSGNGCRLKSSETHCTSLYGGC